MIIEDVGRFLNHEGTSDEDFASKELQKISTKDASEGSCYSIKQDIGRIQSTPPEPPHQTIIEESNAQAEDNHRSLRHTLSSTIHSTNSPPTHIHHEHMISEAL